MTTLSSLATCSSLMAFPVGFLCCFILCLPFPAIAFFSFLLHVYTCWSSRKEKGIPHRRRKQWKNHLLPFADLRKGIPHRRSRVLFLFVCQLWCSLGVSVRVGHLEGKEKSVQLGSLTHSTLCNSTFLKKKNYKIGSPGLELEGDLIFLAFQEQRHEVDSLSIPGMVRNWSSYGARSIWILTLDINLFCFLGGLMRFVFHISYKQQVKGLQDINQLLGLLVPLLCDVPDFVSVIRWLISLIDFIVLHFQEASVFIEGSYSQIGINLKELCLFAVFKFDSSTSRKYLCMDHYCNPFSTDELQTMVRIASFCLPPYLFSYYISNCIDSYITMFTFLGNLFTMFYNFFPATL
ncbi:hypothetical protein ACFX1X_016814 [Malus domestica]